MTSNIFIKTVSSKQVLTFQVDIQKDTVKDLISQYVNKSELKL
jgi:hypothetical protein